MRHPARVRPLSDGARRVHRRRGGGRRVDDARPERRTPNTVPHGRPEPPRLRRHTPRPSRAAAPPTGNRPRSATRTRTCPQGPGRESRPPAGALSTDAPTMSHSAARPESGALRPARRATGFRETRQPAAALPHALSDQHAETTGLSGTAANTAGPVRGRATGTTMPTWPCWRRTGPASGPPGRLATS